ncbi:MAG: ribosome silencing factor [Elusimicrobiota bacterium]
MARGFKSLIAALAKAADAKKAEDVLALKLGRKSPIADYLLIATALSKPHLETLEDSLGTAARDLGLFLLHRSRPKSDRWRVLDFGKIIIHLMTTEARDFYALEKLYHEASPVDWEKPGLEETGT